jgi:hypothetical protein
MSNLDETFAKIKNLGTTPAQLLESQRLAQISRQAELYKEHFDKNLNKYNPSDKRYILDNLQKDSRLAKDFVKEIIGLAEKEFDKE